MAVMSSGRKNRPSKVVKGGTSTTKKHRFQSFNQRISNLSIDPIRRSRNVDLGHNQSDETVSYLKTSLDRWKDLNLSENFVAFLREALPFCNSLPQIIHNQQDLVNIILRYVEKRDVLSLEPLLDLLANFAHDLGARFENHFGTAVSLVATLAATHPAVEVIEWSFTCLAWLFKYLSRLLVPDLKPLYQVMAPLLGKETQRVHTTQFASEAFSYLLRMTAVSYHKNRKPLENIVKYIIDDLGSMEATTESVRLYQHGLMALFVESIKGIERKLHSCGSHIYRTLLEQILEATVACQTRGAELICGVTVGLLHFTDADGFDSIQQIMVDAIARLNLGSRDASVDLCGRLIFVASSVRKGSRITDWDPVLTALTSLLGLCDIASDATYMQMYKAAAVILQTAPLEVVLPHIRSAMDVLTHKRHAQHFLAFCIDFYDLGKERFDTIISPYFKR